jgi:anti-sigma factor RsiW
MGNIVPLHDDAHSETQQLLPWYLNGTLEESERARVDAHLAGCEECRADLERERVIGVRIAGAAPDVERGWADMQARMRAAGTPKTQHWFRRRVPMGWAVGAQAAAAALFVAILLPGHQAAPAPAYHALASAPDARAANGNLIVMFADTSTERDLRAALARSNARIVGGPTEAGAYVLHVGDAERERALAQLRGDTHVTLAEPIDPAGTP